MARGVRLLTPALDFSLRPAKVLDMSNPRTEFDQLLSLHAEQIEAGDVILGGPYGEEVTVLDAFRCDWLDGTRSLLHAAKGDAVMPDHGFQFLGGCVDHYYDLNRAYAVRRTIKLPEGVTVGEA